MKLTLQTDRFDVETGNSARVQCPAHSAEILNAIYECISLAYGDYDRVSFETNVGMQRFRSLPGGHNTATKSVVEVACVELSFFVPTVADLAEVIEAVYAKHPYEEPVIEILSRHRALHRRGMDEDNLNRFWNRETEDWVPEAPR